MNLEDLFINNEIIEESEEVEEEVVLETSPIIEQLNDNLTVSDNSIDYTEYLNTIIERLEGIEENVQSISDNIVSISDDIGNGNYNQTVSVNTVSDNIMNKPLNKYNTQESISLFILLALIVGGLIYLIRKGLPSWH